MSNEKNLVDLLSMKYWLFNIGILIMVCCNPQLGSIILYIKQPTGGPLNTAHMKIPFSQGEYLQHSNQEKNFRYQVWQK